MFAVEIAYAVRAARICLVVAKKIQIERGESAGATGIVESLRICVAHQKLETMIHALGQAGLQCVVIRIE